MSQQLPGIMGYASLNQSGGVKQSENNNSQFIKPPKAIKESITQTANNILNESKNVGNLQRVSPGLSPERLIKKFERDYEDIARFSLDEINCELDKNSNKNTIKKKNL